MVTACGEMVRSDLYRQLGPKMTYYPQKQPVEAEVTPEPPHARRVRVRGGTHTIHPRSVPVTRRTNSTWPERSYRCGRAG